MYFAETLSIHYENTPIQIYWNFHLQKQKIWTKNLIFFIFLLKTKIVGTR